MGIAQTLRLAEPDAVNQTGVIERIADDCIALVEQRQSGERDSHPIGVVEPNTPSMISVELDLSTDSLAATVGVVGAPAPALVTTKLVSDHASFASLAVGFFDGTASAGSYWLDDLALE